MFLASRSMERVGDHAMIIAGQAPALRKDNRANHIRSVLSAQGKAVEGQPLEPDRSFPQPPLADQRLERCG